MEWGPSGELKKSGYWPLMREILKRLVPFFQEWGCPGGGHPAWPLRIGGTHEVPGTGVLRSCHPQSVRVHTTLQRPRDQVPRNRPRPATIWPQTQQRQERAAAKRRWNCSAFPQLQDETIFRPRRTGPSEWPWAVQNLGWVITYATSGRTWREKVVETSCCW